MSTLHGRAAGTASDPIQMAKGVRAALAALNAPDASLTRASALVEVIQQRGLALIMTHGDVDLCYRAREAALRESSGHLICEVNLDRATALGYSKSPEQQFERTLAPLPAPTPIRPETPPAKAEPNAAATMAVMMAMNNGNPLVAAAHCQNLARTAAAPVFLSAKALLIEGFPWIKDKLDAGEIA